MAVVTRAQAPRFERTGFTFHPLAVPSRGSTQLAVWALDAAPGARSERHTVDVEEVFVLHDGAVTIELGDTAEPLSPGDAAIVPPDVPVRLHNTGEVPASLTVCTSAGIRGTVNGVSIDPPWSR
ncbi:cupin domain-containing protein [Saccharomonospora piscinae]|uniref:cupin domain-containing protein n=1 Tax=Saccharomonospora piscinae TaxID=687388 RepID=UPI000466B521|nr:cupin domain-containing protein [Saccharomonospora piscinae]TLW90569.1 cupin domain-containing protein [Saccharomonospora piscinae]